MRNLIGKIVESNPDLTVAGTAMNGNFLLKKLPRLNPDVIILDLEMPEMNGIEFLKERRRQNIDIPVIILSSIARKGARITMEALSLGAADFIMKPSGAVSEDINTVAARIIETVHAYGTLYRREKGKEAPPPLMVTPSLPKKKFTVESPVSTKPPDFPPANRTGPEPDGIKIIAIGISTGGPNALREVFSKIDPDLPVPIVVVQHMPEGFTEEFANSLDRICPLEVKEAAEGDIIKPGRVLIAPGNHHLEVEKRRLATIAHITTADPVNGHRPSADVLFASVTKYFKNNMLGVIMTGMGKDGAREIGTIYNSGGFTIGQDEASSIVYGMPRVARDLGYIQRQVSLHDMADTISSIVADYY